MLPCLEQLRIAECFNNLKPGLAGVLGHILALPLLAHLHICEGERRAHLAGSHRHASNSFRCLPASPMLLICAE